MSDNFRPPGNPEIHGFRGVSGVPRGPQGFPGVPWTLPNPSGIKSGESIFGHLTFSTFPSIFIHFGQFHATFGLQDPSGSLRSGILLRNGSLGSQIGGLRPQFGVIFGGLGFRAQLAWVFKGWGQNGSPFSGQMCQNREREASK